MKKLAFLASLAVFAFGYAPSAQAIQCDSLAALQCFWDWGGNYKVKNFTSTNPYFNTNGPSKGSNCLEALENLTFNGSGGYFEIISSTGNAIKDTYILKQWNQSCL